MRIRSIIMGALVLVLAIPGLASAQQPSEGGFKVTGGGQTFAGDEEQQGPGDTFGFNARSVAGETWDAADGRFNHIDRDAEATQARGKGTHYRGIVECLRAIDEDMGVARFGGVLQTPVDDELTHFVVDVTDNGEGNAEDDVIIFQAIPEPDSGNACDFDEDAVNDRTQLARGNVKIHNIGSAPDEPEDEETSGLASLLGL